ncbi:hypothetical protein NPIL_505001 [Nephila pilipes]|uniref:Uncharacterized protein n=1 Tax=Nephila pilipes TaxID=299642 RepID=A0A8X6QXT5_NEPPI|nr:hypothetical protein NPIL_505001 [Nephila pilipes]
MNIISSVQVRSMQFHIPDQFENLYRCHLISLYNKAFIPVDLRLPLMGLPKRPALDLNCSVDFWPPLIGPGSFVFLELFSCWANGPTERERNVHGKTEM